MPVIKIDKIHEKNKTIIKLSKSLNLETYPDLLHLIERLTPEECKNLVFDMEDLDYISGSGIKALLKASHKVLDVNGKASIVNPSKEVYGLLKSLYFDLAFDILYN